ncbi:hypothetical protein B0H11DRAFT_2267605 [Mycena galericulata]|nr:hypothetical protein B0H11DRAFT_2267605 [Mycena galericulata]
MHGKPNGPAHGHELGEGEAIARIHAHIAFFAFLVAPPPRRPHPALPPHLHPRVRLSCLYSAFLSSPSQHPAYPSCSWFWPHATMNLLVTGPLVFTAFALGYQATTASETPHFHDPHQKIGLVLLILYLAQVSLGAFIHFVKVPRTFPGGRRPQNYLHAVLGLAIIGLASFQTHYGLWTEWALINGNAHPVSWHCKRFWLGIVVGMFTLYAFGLALVPRQFKQERAARQAAGARGGIDGKRKAGSLEGLRGLGGEGHDTRSSTAHLQQRFRPLELKSASASSFLSDSSSTKHGAKAIDKEFKPLTEFCQKKKKTGLRTNR